MSEITVIANQTTTDFAEGSVFTVERTDYLDKLLENGIVSEYKGSIGGFVQTFSAPMEPDAAPLTDDDAAAAGFDLDNPDALPPASDDGPIVVHAPAEDIAELKQIDITDDTEVASKEDIADLAVEKPSPRPKRGTSVKKSDDVSE